MHKSVGKNMIDAVSKDDAHIVARYNYPYLDGITNFTKQTLLKRIYIFAPHGWSRIRKHTN